MNYEPLEDIVLVKPNDVDENEVSDGGILVPGKVKERPIIGTVIAIGPGQKLESGRRFPVMLKVGDTVVFPKKSGDALYLNGQNLIAIPERYCLFKISEKEN